MVETRDGHAGLGATIVTVLFAGLALAAYPGWNVIGKWLERADAPAWIQAVGSIGAIVGAAWLTRYQAARQEALARRSQLEQATVRKLDLCRALDKVADAAAVVTGHLCEALGNKTSIQRTRSGSKLVIELAELTVLAERLDAFPVLDLPADVVTASLLASVATRRALFVGKSAVGEAPLDAENIAIIVRELAEQLAHLRATQEHLREVVKSLQFEKA